MSIPKMLPWLARKAGIAETHTEELWAEAMRCATEKTGEVESSEHSQAAVSKLLELIEAKGKASRRRQDDNARRPGPERLAILPNITTDYRGRVGSAHGALLRHLAGGQRNNLLRISAGDLARSDYAVPAKNAGLSHLSA